MNNPYQKADIINKLIDIDLKDEETDLSNISLLLNYIRTIETHLFIYKEKIQTLRK
jgi:hypothetical protein